MPPRSLPETIGRYEVVDRLGQGGMGVVYRGRDPRMGGRPVAVKLLHVIDDALRERFLQEAQLAASLLEHRNIVTMYDVGEHEGQPYIVMQFIDGVTLAVKIRDDAQLPLGRKLELLEELTGGLDYAHGLGIVHRDVKPANVMIDRAGVLKILDFGIARIGDSSLTQAGTMIGTPSYMSPEQVQARPLDRRSDIYSVGLVAYELLTSRQAFPGDAMHRVVDVMTGREAPALEMVCPGIDPAIVSVVNKAMRSDPADRYQTLAAMTADIAKVRRRLGLDNTVVVDPVTAVLPAAPTPTPTPSRPSLPTAQREMLAKRRADRIKAHLDSAREKLEAGDFAWAIEECEQAAVLDPDDPEVLESLDQARAAREQGRTREPALARGKTGPSNGGLNVPIGVAGTVDPKPKTETHLAGAERAGTDAERGRPLEPARRTPWIAAGVAILATSGLTWLALSHLVRPGQPRPEAATISGPATLAPVSSTSTVPATPPRPATGPGPDLAAILKAVTTAIVQDNLAGGAEAVDGGLALAPREPQLVSLRDQLIHTARSHAESAKQSADLAQVTNRPEYVEATAEMQLAASLTRDRAAPETRAYLAAQAEFQAAQRLGALSARPASPTTIPPMVAAAATIASTAPTSAPTTTPTTSTTSIAPTIDRATVLNILNEYKDAYRRFDVQGLRRIYPALSDSEIRTVAADKSGNDRCDFQFANALISDVAGPSPRVDVDVLKACKPNTKMKELDHKGQGAFILRKTPDGSWVIGELLIRWE